MEQETDTSPDSERAADWHIPVLLEPILEHARRVCEQKSAPLLVDGTLGDGGHCLALLGALPGARYIGFDQDAHMLERAGRRLMAAGLAVHAPIRATDRIALPEPGGVQLVHGRFDSISTCLSVSNLAADWVLLDLGVSMFHFRSAGRGFSYTDEKLDMRLDFARNETAAQWLNSANQTEIERVIREYGEERFAGRIARRICENRPLESARQLADIVRRVYPPGQRLHPATRTFQAIRIHVNDEMRVLETALDSIPDILAVNGALAVISFHSLEDRPVKQVFRKLAGPRQHRNKYGREEQESRSERRPFEILTPAPILPDAAECGRNPAARSAKLRILRRLIDNNNT